MKNCKNCHALTYGKPLCAKCSHKQMIAEHPRYCVICKEYKFPYCTGDTKQSYLNKKVCQKTACRQEYRRLQSLGVTIQPCIKPGIKEAI